jgi:hypothetical protein
MKLKNLGKVTEQTKTLIYGPEDGGAAICPVGTPKAGQPFPLRLFSEPQFPEDPDAVTLGCF